MKSPFGNMSNILKQAQAMQEQMAKVQEQAATKTVSGTAGGGIVTVTVNGAMDLLSVKIDPEVVKAGDVEMLEVGESTGALPAMLTSVAEFYEEDVQTALGAAMALIEPILLIFMAVFVGGVLISLYLPIFTLGSGIH